jgi:hypothetical protein
VIRGVLQGEGRAGVDDHRVARADALGAAVEGDQQFADEQMEDLLPVDGMGGRLGARSGLVGGWAELLGEGEVRVLGERLARIAPYGPVRPAW